MSFSASSISPASFQRPWVSQFNTFVNQLSNLVASTSPAWNSHFGNSESKVGIFPKIKRWATTPSRKTSRWKWFAFLSSKKSSRKLRCDCGDLFLHRANRFHLEKGGNETGKSYALRTFKPYAMIPDIAMRDTKVVEFGELGNQYLDQ